MADDLGVVDVGHDEDEVLHAALAELAEESVPLDREARPALLGRPVDARVRPGVTPRRAPGRDREWHTRDNHLPGGGRRGDAVDKPAALRRAEHGLAGAVGRRVGAPVLARVKDEHLEEPPPAELPVQAGGAVIPRDERPVLAGAAPPPPPPGARGGPES